MLEFIRQHIGGLLGAVIVGALVFAFALSFGSQSEGWGKGRTEGVEASIGGVSISENTFKYALNILGARDVSQDSAEYAKMRAVALEGLIERQLLLNIARDAGISASVDEVEHRIVRNEIFFTVPIAKLAERIQSSFFISPAMAAQVMIKTGHQVRQSFDDNEGVFDLEAYDKWIRYYLQINEETFVEQQRLEMIAERVRRMLVTGVRVSEREVRDNYERENDTASISYIRLMPGYYADRLDPTPEDLKTYAVASADQVKQYYETNKFKYTNLEKMARARHILIKVAEDATDEEKAKAREEIDGLLVRANAGEDFAELARQFSEDPGSGIKGGDLDYNPKGKMVPEFDEAMFSLEPGQISDVLETKYGFHIIRLVGFREGNISLEEATEEIADILYRRSEGSKRAAAAAEEYLAKLRDGATIESLVPAEAEDNAPAHLKLKVRNTSPFTRNATNIPGMVRAQEVIAAAFELTPEAPIPDQVYPLHDDFMVFVLKERIQPNDGDFDKQQDQLTEELLALKQASWLRDRLRDIHEQAEKSGEIQTESDPAALPATAGPRTGPPADMPLGPEGDEGSVEEPARRGDQDDKEPEQDDEAPGQGGAAEEPEQDDEGDEPEPAAEADEPAEVMDEADEA
ncbi:MAG: peptidylprolyl isomerase, partial [Deltaproteobacteria bacterium]|nr:peptidylprolyl isomerase [Deltaproteobacteria bacterium]